MKEIPVHPTAIFGKCCTHVEKKKNGKINKTKHDITKLFC